MVDPHIDIESTLDLNIHNPLSLDDEVRLKQIMFARISILYFCLFSLYN